MRKIHSHHNIQNLIEVGTNHFQLDLFSFQSKLSLYNAINCGTKHAWRHIIVHTKCNIKEVTSDLLKNYQNLWRVRSVTKKLCQNFKHSYHEIVEYLLDYQKVSRKRCENFSALINTTGFVSIQSILTLFIADHKIKVLKLSQIYKSANHRICNHLIWGHGRKNATPC